MQGARSLASRVRIRIGLTIDPDSGSTCTQTCNRVETCAPGEGCHATPSPEARHETHSTLYKAAHDLYFAGVWTCEGKSEARQVELWEALRDALGLNAGAATAAGVGASPEAREVPPCVDLHVEEWSGGEFICITPADAKRIVALARTGGTE
jgi:hypothetical protein